MTQASPFSLVLSFLVCKMAGLDKRFSQTDIAQECQLLSFMLNGEAFHLIQKKSIKKKYLHNSPTIISAMKM